MTTLLILKATAGDLLGQKFPINGPAHYVLGRSRSCSLRLPGDATVSRQHCLIEVEEDGVWIQDLGSLNGTLVNGAKIGQRERGGNSDATMVQPLRHGLHAGDEVRICNNGFKVEMADCPLICQGTPAHRESSHFTLALCS